MLVRINHNKYFIITSFCPRYCIKYVFITFLYPNKMCENSHDNPLSSRMLIDGLRRESINKEIVTLLSVAFLML